MEGQLGAAFRNCGQMVWTRGRGERPRPRPTLILAVEIPALDASIMGCGTFTTR